MDKGNILQTDPLRVAPQVSEKHRRTVLQGGELLVSVVGSVGEVAVAPYSLAGWNVARAIAVIRPREVSAHWLRYCLQTPQVRESLDSMLNTTVQATLNLADLRRLEVSMPPEEVRRAIVEVLGALDDKIAANDGLGRTMLGLADAVFARDVETAIPGPTFADVASVLGGGTPRTKVDEYWNGDINWATPTDITALSMPYLERTARLITEEGLGSCSSILHPAGSILMTSRATIGAFAIAEAPTAVNQGFIVVNANDPALQWWLFHEMRSRVPEFLAHANGATFLELSRGKFKRFQVRVPDAEAAKSFGATVGPLHARARAAAVESTVLAETRDVLLPGLMSGKIRVKDAERVVGEAV